MIVYPKWDVRLVVRVVVELFARKAAHIVAMEAVKSLAVAIVLMIVAVTAMIHAKVLLQPILSKTELWTSMYPNRFIGCPDSKTQEFAIMNDSKEIQTRREFFKRAAKGILPIIGSVAIVGMPIKIFAKEEPRMGCSGCKDECFLGCGGCAYGCEGCTGTCNDGCQSTCVGGCSGECQGNCKDDCVGNCYKTCQGGCQNSCSGSCSDSCAGSSKQ